MIGFTVTLANTGQVAYTGITVATDPSEVFANATSNGDQAATSGTIVVTPTGASWTGSIPVGGTVTITGYGHGGQSRYREQDPGRGAVHHRGGQQLPARRHRPGLHHHRPVSCVPGLTHHPGRHATSAVPGQQVIGYTVTITNTGQTTYTGTAVTVSFAQMLDDAAYDGDARPPPRRDGDLRRPGADLDRGPGARGHRGHHATRSP